MEDAMTTEAAIEPDAPTWRPVVTELALRERLLHVIREISDGIAAHAPNPANVDTFADRAILRAYLSQDDAVSDDDDLSAAALATAVTTFSEGRYPASLHGGAAKVGFTVAHLAGGVEADEVCGAVDTALLRRLEESPWSGDYDLIVGLVGIGVYGFERSDHEGGRRVAMRVLDHLEQLARPTGAGIAWFTARQLLPDWQRAVAPDGYINLGLAHGNPGVVALLARYVVAGIEPERSRALLVRAMDYLLAVEPRRERGRFPSWYPSNGETGSTRLAWCYGDLGVAMAFLAAAHATGNVEMARTCATRTLTEASVHDAGLCHGTTGAVHLFNRLWHATGEDVFAVAARAWIDHTLAIRNAHWIAGFPAAAREPDATIAWNPDDSLLAGASGVALALHAAISNIEPSWDRMLLCDVPTLRRE